MSQHSQGDVDSDAIDLVSEASRRLVRGAATLSHSMAAIGKAILPHAPKGDHFVLSAGRLAEKGRLESERRCKSADPFARDVLLVQTVALARLMAAKARPDLRGAPPEDALRLDAAVSSSLRRAYEGIVGHDLETGRPIDDTERHSRHVHPKIAADARRLHDKGLSTTVALATDLYDEMVGAVQRERGQKTLQDQLSASRRRNARQMVH